MVWLYLYIVQCLPQQGPCYLRTPTLIVYKAEDPGGHLCPYHPSIRLPIKCGEGAEAACDPSIMLLLIVQLETCWTAPFALWSGFYKASSDTTTWQLAFVVVAFRVVFAALLLSFLVVTFFLLLSKIPSASPKKVSLFRREYKSFGCTTYFFRGRARTSGQKKKKKTSRYIVAGFRGAYINSIPRERGE